MGGSTPSGSTTTVQKSDPWTGQQPYLKQGFQGAENLYQNYTPGYYPNSTNAAMNDWQGNALQGIYGRGMQGSSVDANAQNAVQNYTSGNMLSAGNPYFQQAANTVAQTVTPQVMSQFEQSGRYGSGAAANALASALANKEGDMAYQNYNQGQTNQLQAAALSPQTSATDYTNMNAALGAGGQLQAQQQNAINSDVGRYNYYQQLPYQQLQNYQQAINGTYGGTQSTSQPYFTNPVANAAGAASGIGGLLSGAGTLGSLFGGASVPTWAGAMANGAMVFSDRRLKENIERIGKSKNNLPIYAYNYKGDGTTHIGFMADEVEKKNPDAVREIGGFKAVDYAKAVQ